MSTFITNHGNKDLKRRLQELIEISTELKFLVGFFYFSGIKEFYETLKNLYEEGKLSQEHIKILVGLNVDKGNYGLYEAATKLKSKDEYFQALINSVKTAFTSQELDNQDIYEQAEFFVKLLEEKIIVIRKTREPNHSKLYLFKTKEKSAPSLFITGSSNLTRAGLVSQNEFNVEIKDYGFEEAEKYFDDLWKDSIPLSEDDVKKLVNTIKNETALRDVDPFSAYVYLLKTYIETHKTKDTFKDLVELMERKGYKPYSYQMEAVSQAIANCKSHGGTILADVVGLGKTVVACMVAKALGKRGIVIAPPHLIGNEEKSIGWRKYLEDFELYGWETYSVGKLEKALEFVREHDNIEVVIVDEAHRFRNENTLSYHYLKEICRGKTVLLLTATPFNNRPSDIFALLKLFTIPKKSTIVFDEDLKSKFEEYESLFNKLSYIKNHYNSPNKKKRERALNYYKEIFGKNNVVVEIDNVKTETKELARHIRSILEPVVIRRNRLDLKHYKEKVDLSEVKDPIEWFYELTKEQSGFYDEVISAFSEEELGGRFKGAIYIPIKYEKGIKDDDEPELKEEESFLLTYQRNLYDFMRRLLVKRFESSFGSFYESIKRFKSIHETALDFVKKTNKFILDRKLMEDLAEKDSDEILKELEKYEQDLKEQKINAEYYKIYDLSNFKQKDKFIKDIQNDIELFDEFLEKMEELRLTQNDPKADRLIKGIEEFLKEDRKVVIFTEYTDTAKHLDDILKKHFKDKVLVAYGNIGKTTFEEIAKNFDAQYKHQEDKYKILLTTDKLSEGYNLNRAGAVINYDIPWNPVRVIQRVGRINRIGKKVYDEIYIVNFFPTEQGADIVRSRQIAQTKMFMIHSILGEDAKIFDPSEEPEASKLYKRLNEYKEDEEESFFTKVRDELKQIEENYPEVIKEIQNMPQRVKTAKQSDKNELMVFIRKGKDLFVGYKDYAEKQPKTVSFEEVYEKIKATAETERLRVSKDFWANYKIVLDKKAYIKRKPKSRTIEGDALNLLNDLKDKDIGELRSFVLALIKDIEEYSSLSEYILQRIVKIEKYLDNIEEVKKELEEIKKEIGEDFIERVESQLKLLDLENQEVIMAVENQEFTSQM
ncbi:helicase-related protein [Sulfurihydrogenibium sp.]|uniref:helicase-related protein n=1 Tax=Sulfurihydrogenibium sp. TaxID=2053621 RepID=UPI00260EDE84|nr:helicase-related protein [Sulfurihydrogenibium sp.]